MLGSIFRWLTADRRKGTSYDRLLIASSTPAARWAVTRPGSAVLRAAAAGRYGETPTWLYLGEDETGVALESALEGTARKIDVGRVEKVVLALTDEEMSPQIELYLPEDRQADRVVSVEIAYRAADPDPLLADRVRAVVAVLAVDAHSEYVLAHDRHDFHRREEERGRRPLFPAGSARGPYWFTYYDGDVLQRLGGLAAALSLPAYRTSASGTGALIQSHADCEALDRDPKQAELRTLDEALKRLAG